MTVSEKLDRVLANLQTIHANQIALFAYLKPMQLEEHQIMTALTDLQAAIAGLATAIGAATAEITVLLGKIAAPGVSDADVAAATAAIQAQVTAIDAAVAAAKTASP